MGNTRLIYLKDKMNKLDKEKSKILQKLNQLERKKQALQYDIDFEYKRGV